MEVSVKIKSCDFACISRGTLSHNDFIYALLSCKALPKTLVVSKSFLETTCEFTLHFERRVHVMYFGVRSINQLPFLQKVLEK